MLLMISQPLHQPFHVLPQPYCERHQSITCICKWYLSSITISNSISKQYMYVQSKIWFTDAIHSWYHSPLNPSLLGYATYVRQDIIWTSKYANCIVAPPPTILHLHYVLLPWKFQRNHCTLSLLSILAFLHPTWYINSIHYMSSYCNYVQFLLHPRLTMQCWISLDDVHLPTMTIPANNPRPLGTWPTISSPRKPSPPHHFAPSVPDIIRGSTFTGDIIAY